MSFDPYQKWLGIPPHEQPPNHYRLLGIKLFELNLNAIADAALMRSELVRQCAGESRPAELQQLLKDISAAKTCLLTPTLRRPYDTQLKATLASTPSATANDEPVAFSPDEMVRVRCPSCGFIFRVHQRYVGTQRNCPSPICDGVCTVSLDNAGTDEARRLKLHPIVWAFSGAGAALVLVMLVTWVVSGAREKAIDVADASTDTPVADLTPSDNDPPAADDSDPSSETMDDADKAPEDELDSPEVIADSPPETKTQQPPDAPKSIPLPELAKLVDLSLVEIRTNKGLGSGFLVRDTQTVVTNFHVIEGAKVAKAIFSDKSEVDVAGFLAIDPSMDLAILGLKSGNPSHRPLSLSSDEPMRGLDVVAIGSPQGFANTMSAGIISSVRTGAEINELFKTESAPQHSEYRSEMTWVQMTAPISPGNSGGPLLLHNGTVIGVNSWSVETKDKDAHDLNFAVSARDVRSLLGNADQRLQSLSALPAPREPPPRQFDQVGDPSIARRFKRILEAADTRDKLLLLQGKLAADIAALQSLHKNRKEQLAVLEEAVIASEFAENVLTQQFNASIDDNERAAFATRIAALNAKCAKLRAEIAEFAPQVTLVWHQLSTARTSAKDVREKAREMSQEWLRLVDPFGKWSHADLELSLAFLNMWISKEKNFTLAYVARGAVLAQLGRDESALVDFDKAMKLDSTQAEARACRALVYSKLGKVSQSRDDLNKARSLDAKSPIVHLCQGLIRVSDKKFADAIQSFKIAVRCGDDHPVPHHYLARLLAVCEEPKLRNGKEAVRLAEIAISRAEVPVWIYGDTLAAAYAEDGQFELAVKTQTKVVELAPDEARQDCTGRLELYKAGKPCRSVTAVWQSAGAK